MDILDLAIELVAENQWETPEGQARFHARGQLSQLPLSPTIPSAFLVHGTWLAASLFLAAAAQASYPPDQTSKLGYKQYAELREDGLRLFIGHINEVLCHAWTFEFEGPIPPEQRTHLWDPRQVTRTWQSALLSTGHLLHRDTDVAFELAIALPRQPTEADQLVKALREPLSPTTPKILRYNGNPELARAILGRWAEITHYALKPAWLLGG